MRLADPSAEDAPVIARDRSTIRILVGDPDTAIRDALSTSLRADGFTVITADTGTEALRAAQVYGPRIALLEIMLPELNGFEVCRRLKEHEATRDISVAFITGLRDGANIRHGHQVGGDDYLVKPFTVWQVTARVRALLHEAGAASVHVDSRVRSCTNRQVPSSCSSLHLVPPEFPGAVSHS